MMNKYHWARAELEERFPIGTKVLYHGTTNPRLTGRKGVVTGYSQSGGVKINFGDAHAIVLPDKIAVVPVGTEELEERFPIGSRVRYGKGDSTQQGCDKTGAVIGYSHLGYIKVQPDVSHYYLKKPENLTIIPASPKAEEQQSEVKSDVTHPNHYMLFDNVEAIEIIARSMTVEAFRGYCLGNILKYRLRAGKKSELATMEKDLKKAAFYQELFDKYKGLCHDAT